MDLLSDALSGEIDNHISGTEMGYVGGRRSKGA